MRNFFILNSNLAGLGLLQIFHIDLVNETHKVILRSKAAFLEEGIYITCYIYMLHDIVA